MSATLSRWNKIHVGLGDQVATFRQPLNCPVNRLGFTLKITGKRRLRDHWKIDGCVSQIIGNTVLVKPFSFFFFLLIQ